MKVIVFSDAHGILPKIDTEFDLMLICGDICPVDDHRLQWQKEWLSYNFTEWINALPFKDERSRVVFIGGNHDIYLSQAPYSSIHNRILSKCNSRLVYLCNEEYTFFHFNGTEIKKYRIFGTPYCKIFGNWAFMHDDEYLNEKFSEIPANLDFLITHDPPNINDCGTILQKTRWSDGTKQAGNDILVKHIFETKPKYVFSGHIHSGNHELTEFADNCKIANVSLLNEFYNPVYKPLILDI